MIINEQTLIRLPVFTESGDKLGHVIDIEIDVDDHQIRKYLVGGMLQKNSYLVSATQVKSITKEKIIVVDSVLKLPAKGLGRRSVIPGKLNAALQIKIE